MTLKRLVPAIYIGLTLLGAIVGFHILFTISTTEFSKEFIAGCIGALITIVATAVLLKSQTNSEILKDQANASFQTKLEIYSEFIDHLNLAHKDNVLSREELNKTIDLSLRLALVCKPRILVDVTDYIFQLTAYNTAVYQRLTEENEKNWFEYVKVKLRNADYFDKNEDREMYFVTYGEIIQDLREDLLDANPPTEGQHMAMAKLINSILAFKDAKSARFDVESGCISIGHHADQLFYPVKVDIRKVRPSS